MKDATKNIKSDKMKIQTIVSAFLIGLTLFSCSETPSSKIQKSTKITFAKEGTLQIKDSVNKAVAAFDIEIADDDYTRETGLMYRKEMKENNAMLFIFEKQKPLYFYMKNTYIPLDIIYINSNNRVVSIAKDAKPLDETTLPSKVPAKYVLEVNGGLTEQLNIKKGDKVSWQKL